MNFEVAEVKEGCWVKNAKFGLNFFIIFDGIIKYDIGYIKQSCRSFIEAAQSKNPR